MNAEQRVEYWRKREEEERLEKMLYSHVCGECGSALFAPWDPEKNEIVLLCARDRSHQGYVKATYGPLGKLERVERVALACAETPEQMQKIRDEVAEMAALIQDNKVSIKERRNMVREQIGEEQEKALAPYYGVTHLTTEQAGMIADTLWPKAPLPERMKAALICATYGLNPLKQHLHLVKFETKHGDEWVPILAIQAKRLISSRKEAPSYLVGPRIMTKQEQEEILGRIDEDNIWSITILAGKDGRHAPGYGFWPKTKPAYGADKGNSQENMAHIHSESQALDRFNPGEMPEGVETMELQYLPAGTTEQPKKPGTTQVAPPELATEAQRRKLFTAAKQMGYTNGEVHNTIKANFGIESTKDLTKDQASKLIEMIERGQSLPAQP